MQTLQAILDRNRGIGPGFDFLRLALSFSVIVFHAFQLPRGFEAMRIHGPAIVLVAAIVPAFFALSGFLVAGSLVRIKKTSTFLLFRALRIVPALAAEITLSALILGPLVTTLPLVDYFSSTKFWTYFTNVVGIINYELPGVFLDNPVPARVNGQLWTVPIELECYIGLALLMIFGIAERRVLLLGLLLTAGVFECSTVIFASKSFGWGLVQTREMLILCFIAGNVFYLWRDRIPSSPLLFVASVIGYCVVVYLVPSLSFVLGVFSITYFIVYLGLHRMPKPPVLMRGDYSYGLYLYSFPIQQAVVWAFPSLREWYFNLAISAPIALLFAMGSWHFLEKPVLSLRRKFVTHPTGQTDTGKVLLESDTKTEGSTAA